VYDCHILHIVLLHQFEELSIENHHQEDLKDLADLTSITDMTTELPPYWNGEWYRRNVDNELEMEPTTLLEWFKSLTLDEKVEVYNDYNKVDYNGWTDGELIVTW